MAKLSYGTPASIDRPILDAEISPFKGSTIQIKLFSIVYGLASIGLLFLIVKMIPLLSYDKTLFVVFLVLWMFATIFLFNTNKYGEVNFKKLIYLQIYLSSVKKIFTRSKNKAFNFAKIVNILDIDDSNGVVYFSDGYKGLMFEVVGNASFMLFETDRNALLDNVDTFYRKFSDKVRFHQIHMLENQDVYMQLGALQSVVDNMQANNFYDEDCNRLLALQGKVLSRQIGKQFSIIKHYMIVSAPSMDELQLSYSMLADEVRSRGLVLKQMDRLRKGDICQVLKTVLVG